MQSALSNAAHVKGPVRMASAYANPWKILIWIAEPDAADWLIRQSRHPIMPAKQMRRARSFYKKKKEKEKVLHVTSVRDIVARQGEIITRTSRHDGEILIKDHKETMAW